MPLPKQVGPAQPRIDAGHQEPNEYTRKEDAKRTPEKGPNSERDRDQDDARR